MLTIEKVGYLRATDVFANTPDQILAAVAQIAEDVILAPGFSFIQQGDYETDMFVIISGQVQVQQNGIALATIGAGSIVGEMNLLSPAPREATVTTLTETQVLRIEKEALLEVMRDRFEIVMALFDLLIKRLRSLNDVMAGNRA